LKLFLLFSVLTLFLFNTHAVEAFTVTPSYLDLSVERGEKVEKTVSIFNEATEAARFSFEVADVKFSEDSVPQFLLDQELGGNSIKWWVNFEDSMLDLQPGEKKDLKIRLSIPDGADPGGHYGAIVFSRVNPNPEQNKTAVGLNQKLASLLFFNVEGQVFRTFEVGRFGANSSINNSLPVNFTILINNRGNTHLQPHGLVTIYDVWRNKKVGQVVVNEQFLYLFPQGNKLFEAQWVDSDPLGSIWRYFGPYKAVLEMKAEGASDVKVESQFWVLPGTVVMVFLGAGLLFITALLVYTKVVLSRHKRGQRRSGGRGGYG